MSKLNNTVLTIFSLLIFSSCQLTNIPISFFVEGQVQDLEGKDISLIGKVCLEAIIKIDNDKYMRFLCSTNEMEIESGRISQSIIKEISFNGKHAEIISLKTYLNHNDEKLYGKIHNLPKVIALLNNNPLVNHSISVNYKVNSSQILNLEVSKVISLALSASTHKMQNQILNDFSYKNQGNLSLAECKALAQAASTHRLANSILNRCSKFQSNL
ncbi:MAG: hypothetical protein N4A33_10255 [Bacteriovoracaceae bacterium]|jgi:hypothetical protein|nr:hypothetical protein [Bacteriovoracaceae bacterium]